MMALSMAAPGYAQNEDFPYPDLPDTLSRPEARAEYLITHYWDHYDFADTTLANKVAEQGFVNFLDLLPRFDSLTAVEGVERFVALAGEGGNATVRHYFRDLTRHYLAQRDSPMRHDSLYALFLSTASLSPLIDEAERERCAALARETLKNTIGTLASNFSYIDSEGRLTTLYDTEAKWTVVFFNDPDCERCRETDAQLRAHPLLSHPDVRLLDVHPDEQTEALYYLPSLPSLYLLDAHKKVVAKDVSVDALLSTLSRLLSSPQPQ